MEGTIYLNRDSNTDLKIAKPTSENEVVKPEITTVPVIKEEPAVKPEVQVVVTEPQKIENPNVIKLNPAFKKYVQEFKKAVIEENKPISNPIVVDEIASKVAKFYEVIRRVVDWKEEHLIRRTVIERMLKRRLVSEIYGNGILPTVNPVEIAEPFVFELVRSGYFINGGIERDAILRVQKVLEKYIYILRNGVMKNGVGTSKREKKAGLKKKLNFYYWVIEIAACEIEEVLDAPLREYALLNLMTECLCERIKIIPEGKMSEEEKYIQTYIAVHRTLFNLDAPIISYHLVKHKYLDLFQKPDLLPIFTEKVLDIWQEIQTDLSHPKAAEFYRIAEKYDAPYLMIGDSMNKLSHNINDIESKISNEATLLTLSETSYRERLATLKARLFKLAIFSTLSIFVAGSASLVIFEIPIAHWVHGYFNPWAIVADIGIPTALMFILVWMIRPPAENNLVAIKEEIERIVFPQIVPDIYEIRLKKRIKKFFNALFFVIYLAGGLASMYLIYWVFKIATVPWTSLYIDTVNVAMIVFAAMVIRQRAKELTVVEKDNIVEFVMDFFSIPLAKLGSWFSEKWKEYNIVSVFFTALIDFPVSSFVATIEGWRNFIKEKRSEIH